MHFSPITNYNAAVTDGRAIAFESDEEFAVTKALAIGMLTLAVAGGCSSSKKSTASSVTEPLSPAPTAYQAPQPYSPSPVAAQPVTYDSAPAPAMTSAAPV